MENNEDQNISFETESKTELKQDVAYENISRETQEFLDARVHFGHVRSKVHSNMLPYIVGMRNNIHIIDVYATIEGLHTASEFLKKCIKENKKILFVGTKYPIRGLVEEVATELKMPYITLYWPGGFLTNWNTIKSRIEWYKKLKALRDSDEWMKYTKQERSLLTRNIEKLEARWSGVEDMEVLPDVLCIADMEGDRIAAVEARKKGIPVVALVDTNINIEDVDYPIPANDDSVQSVSLLLTKLKEAMRSSQ